MAMTTLQKNLVFFGGSLLMVGTLTFLAAERKTRYVPEDEHHPRPLAVALCRDCHAPGKMSPQLAKHPPKDQCMLCHRDRAKKP
jgi:cytochrome c553